jgi:hypothetical protein
VVTSPDVNDVPVEINCDPRAQVEGENGPFPSTPGPSDARKGKSSLSLFVMLRSLRGQGTMQKLKHNSLIQIQGSLVKRTHTKPT